jgi:hypothetical protein
MAAQARGAKSAASNVLRQGMLVRRRVQVDRSLGSMSSLVQTLAVMESAWALVKALGILETVSGGAWK